MSPGPLVHNKPRNKQQGVAVIVLLTIIVLGMATALVSRVSVNALKAERVRQSADQLDQGLQALLGFSLRQPTPGVLPCPDTTGDGFANPAGAGCDNQLGLLPSRTLDVPDLADASGADLWYAVTPALTAGSSAAKNPSTPISLTLDGSPVAAVLIAPGAPIGGQDRVPLNAADFLEGINADGNTNTFSSIIDDTQNDQVLAVDPGTLWHVIQQVATTRAVNLLESYRIACGEYPWAADPAGSADSVDGSESGTLPLGIALPVDWGGACGPSAAPDVDNWLSVHWQDQLFYRMCPAASGDCVTVTNHPGNSARGVVIAPGTATGAQSRPGSFPLDYFEADNADGDDTTFLRLAFIQHTNDFNDWVVPLGP